MLFLAVSYISGYQTHVNALKDKTAITDFSHGFLNSVAYILPLMYSIITCSIFANFSVVLDKAKRTIESLMATPISITQIWMGKSLAVTLPSIAVGLSVSLLVYIVLNVGFVIPKVGFFIFPSLIAIITALIIVPVLIFSIVAIVIFVQLVIANPRIANLVFSAIFLLLFFGINFLGGLGISLDYFSLIYLGVIVMCGVISYILSHFLTKEKVLLSSKA
jgi:ABC-type Na+ efflux pump permease subunit